MFFGYGKIYESRVAEVTSGLLVARNEFYTNLTLNSENVYTRQLMPGNQDRDDIELQANQ